MKSEIEAKIEYQKTIGEVRPGSYRPVRFSRVKYKASPEAHIDIRQYQRGYDDEGETAYYPTKTGFQFPESAFRRVLEEYTLLPGKYIHPAIAKASFRLWKSEEFDAAVLKAFKKVEMEIRKRIKANADDIGVSLVRRAFNPKSGPLTDMTLPMAEREALCNYVAGALGYYKNPCSHRDVEMDSLSAFERLVVASVLLKIVEEAPSDDN